MENNLLQVLCHAVANKSFQKARKLDWRRTNLIFFSVFFLIVYTCRLSQLTKKHNRGIEIHKTYTFIRLGYWESTKMILKLKKIIVVYPKWWKVSHYHTILVFSFRTVGALNHKSQTHMQMIHSFHLLYRYSIS